MNPCTGKSMTTHFEQMCAMASEIYIIVYPELLGYFKAIRCSCGPTQLARLSKILYSSGGDWKCPHSMYIPSFLSFDMPQLFF